MQELIHVVPACVTAGKIGSGLWRAALQLVGMMKESAFCHPVVVTAPSAVSSLNNVDQEILFGSESSSAIS